MEAIMISGTPIVLPFSSNSLLFIPKILEERTSRVAVIVLLVSVSILLTSCSGFFAPYAPLNSSHNVIVVIWIELPSIFLILPAIPSSPLIKSMMTSLSRQYIIKCGIPQLPFASFCMHFFHRIGHFRAIFPDAR